jgi:hypothetical protein
VNTPAMRPFHSAAVLALATVVLAGCGSSSSTAVRLTSASTCAQWNSAGLTAQRAYVSRALGQPIEEGNRGGAFGSSQWFLNGWLTTGCKTAAHSGSATTTQLGSVATTQEAVEASNGKPPHAPPTSSPTARPPTATAPPPDKAAPNPKGPVAFSRNGRTEHGDEIHVVGHFGPILPPDESDVDQSVLDSCAETNGRELVRRLDLSLTITSGLAGDVQVAPPMVSVNEEEGAEEIRNLNFVVAGPEGTSCHKGLGEETGFTVDLGTLQPHQTRTLSVWVALINAITPADPHPSLKKLRSQEWAMTEPAVTVDGALAISGGGVSVTE